MATLFIPNQTVKPGETIEIPINIDDATGVLGIDLEIKYDTALIDLNNIVLGDLNPNFSIVPNIIEAEGIARVAIFGTISLTEGEGSIAKLRLTVPESSSGEITLDLVTADINEQPVGTLTDGVLTIQQDVIIPSLAIAPTNAIRLEGNEGLTPFTFTVTRTGDTTGTSSANWAVTSTSANAADFGGTLPTGTVTFGAGETTREITVNVQGDTIPEQNETFRVTLTEANNATITTATATGTIINDDGDRQQIFSGDNLLAVPNSTLSVPLLYNTSNGDNTLTGISLRLHYNSNELSFQGVENFFNTSVFSPVVDQADNNDFDNDPQSDRYIQFAYLDFFGNWP
ncbi:cohesin domain-containing protein, partial [Anabaenopsis sp. FSS-46]|uniref:cohesin domain-containing protein n=1 Tax=Anabaenopsis sp. FSS-46 TaxID=2971766 RepID=UPI002475ADD0